MHGRVIDIVFVPAPSSPNNREQSPTNTVRPQPIVSQNHSRHTIPSITCCFYSIVEYKGLVIRQLLSLGAKQWFTFLAIFSASTIARDTSSVPDKSKAPCGTSGTTDWLPNEVNFGLLNSRSIASKLADFQSFVYTSISIEGDLRYRNMVVRISIW